MAVASSTMSPTPPRARASWYATNSSVGMWSWTSVVWCAVETIRFGSSTEPTRSDLRRWEGSSTAELARGGGPLPRAKGSRAPGLGVAGDEHGLRLCGELAADGHDLLARRQA